jgi:hypothetical protein
MSLRLLFLPNRGERSGSPQVRFQQGYFAGRQLHVIRPGNHLFDQGFVASEKPFQRLDRRRERVEVQRGLAERLRPKRKEAGEGRSL